jgi:hypothetical protein
MRGAVTIKPCGAWMLQMGRNLPDADSGLLRDGGVLLMDRQTKLSHALLTLLVHSIKDECLSRVVPIGRRTARRALDPR